MNKLIMIILVLLLSVVSVAADGTDDQGQPNDPAVNDPEITAFPFTYKLFLVPIPPYTTNAAVVSLVASVESVIVARPEMFVVKRLELPCTVAPPYKNNDAELKLLAVESKIEIGWLKNKFE